MRPNRTPTFRDLTRAECEAILARNHVGRLAYTFHDRVDIEPIHYVYDEGWIYGRTAPGTKLATLAHHRWVAFEVDEAEGIFDWRSVTVHGAFYILTHDAPAPPDVMRHAIDLLRDLLPETLTDQDPVPFRTVLFRVHASEITGREATTDPPASLSGDPARRAGPLPGEA